MPKICPKEAHSFFSGDPRGEGEASKHPNPNVPVLPVTTVATHVVGESGWFPVRYLELGETSKTPVLDLGNSSGWAGAGLCCFCLPP